MLCKSKCHDTLNLTTSTYLIYSLDCHHPRVCHIIHSLSNTLLLTHSVIEEISAVVGMIVSMRDQHLISLIIAVTVAILVLAMHCSLRLSPDHPRALDSSLAILVGLIPPR
jgi:hypothetical protein